MDIIQFLDTLVRRSINGEVSQDFDYTITDNILKLGLSNDMYLQTRPHNLGIEPTNSNDAIEVSGDFGGILLPYDENRNTLHRLILTIELVSCIELENKEEYKNILVIC